MNKFLCMIGIHMRSKWSTINTGEILRVGVEVGAFELQRNECSRCGKAFLRYARTC